jgi:hypothetical protein
MVAMFSRAVFATHNAAQTGGITRSVDALDVAQFVLYALLALTVLVACVVTYVLVQDHKTTQARETTNSKYYKGFATDRTIRANNNL